MNRCELFARLTKSDDESLVLFERILDGFFEEYSFLYGALAENGLVDSVNLGYVESGTDNVLKVRVTLTKQLVSGFFIESVTKFLTTKLGSECSIDVERETGDTALITFRKG